MRLIHAALATAALTVGLVASAPAQVGEQLPADVDLDDFAQTGAKSLEDLRGRAILIEFFAYW